MARFLSTLGLGNLAIARGDIQTGKVYLNENLRNVPSAIDKAISLQLWLFILGEQGRKEEAVEIIAFIDNYKSSFPKKSVEGYPWYQRLRPELEAELSAEEFTAAWERGKNMNLDDIVKGILAEEE
ncbi:MAG: hypothetical protein FVQ83_16410 [Chloroflexi bacterium]|nr:hypothetical protein [Chloroflexota bacterium]